MIENILTVNISDYSSYKNRFYVSPLIVHQAHRHIHILQMRHHCILRAITAFKVIQGHRGRYQSKARMRFPISD